VHRVLDVIAGCRREYGLETRVPAILEPDDYALFAVYRRRRSAYFVALVNDEVVGGAGIARLENAGPAICELQRMYLRGDCRAQGVGRTLLLECLRTARAFGYAECYAETISPMTTAIAFYEGHGFQRLSAPRGRTGHAHTDCWFRLALRPSDAGTEAV
jgi:putative acetyltransferase